MTRVLYDTKGIVTSKKKVVYDCCEANEDVWYWVSTIKNDRNVKNLETMCVVLHRIRNRRRKRGSLRE